MIKHNDKIIHVLNKFIDSKSAEKSKRPKELRAQSKKRVKNSSDETSSDSSVSKYPRLREKRPKYTDSSFDSEKGLSLQNNCPQINQAIHKITTIPSQFCVTKGINNQFINTIVIIYSFSF